MFHSFLVHKFKKKPPTQLPTQDLKLQLPPRDSNWIGSKSVSFWMILRALQARLYWLFFADFGENPNIPVIQPEKRFI